MKILSLCLAVTLAVAPGAATAAPPPLTTDFSQPEPQVKAVKAMTKEEREQLIRFVESL